MRRFLARVALLTAAGCALGGCQKHEPAVEARPSRPELPADDEPTRPEPRFVELHRSDAVPLETVHFPEPLGEGYGRVGVEIGPSLYSGKWLALAGQSGYFLGPRHVIVNHYPGRPRDNEDRVFEKSVILNIETGEVVLEFEKRLKVNWDRGMVIVKKKGDMRPYLFDTQDESLVLAIPPGKHLYIYGDNYWLRLSPIARRVWITAREREPDREGKHGVHLYEWEDRTQPPPLPDNPFPFVPTHWDPGGSQFTRDLDHEEAILGDNMLSPDGCTRAILTPPRSYRCLDDENLEFSEMLADGWRIDDFGRVLNIETNEGFDLSPLCDDGIGGILLERVEAGIERGLVKVRCKSQREVWGIWSPPGKLALLDEQNARRADTAGFTLHYRSTYDHWEIRTPYGDGIITYFNPHSMQDELVGERNDCKRYIIRGGGRPGFAEGCYHLERPWLDIVNGKRRVRARFPGRDLAFAADGTLVGIRRKGGADHVVRVQLKD